MRAPAARAWAGSPRTRTAPRGSGTSRRCRRRSRPGSSRPRSPRPSRRSSRPCGGRAGTGLPTGPVCALFDVTPLESSCSASLPVIVAPAARSAATTSASTGGVQPSSPGVPAPVGMSAVPIESFTPTGSPCSGPRAASGRRAAASTASGSCVTYAFRPRRRSVRRSSASTYSGSASCPSRSAETASDGGQRGGFLLTDRHGEDPNRCEFSHGAVARVAHVPRRPRSGASWRCSARSPQPPLRRIWEPRATPPATPPSATTASSPTAARPRSSPPTARSTGSAGRASTAPRSSARCSTPEQGGTW